jgi:hypothetical protein
MTTWDQEKLTETLHIFLSITVLEGSHNRHCFVSCLGDIIVGMEQQEQGDVIWGNVIMMIVLLPNFLFLIWFCVAHRKNLFLKGRRKDTWMKIVISGMVQMITFIRYLTILHKHLDNYVLEGAYKMFWLKRILITYS